MTQVRLAPEEILQGSIVGIRRRVDSINRGCRDKTGGGYDWTQEIEGALAEVALAKVKGLYFDPCVGKYKTKDVGEYHVRWTSEETNSLIIRPDDPDGVYVLVIGSFGRYRIAGQIDSVKARTMPEYAKAPNGRPAALFIPQKELEPV